MTKSLKWFRVYQYENLSNLEKKTKYLSNINAIEVQTFNRKVKTRVARISGSTALSDRISGYPVVPDYLAVYPAKNPDIRQGIPDNPAGYPAPGKKDPAQP